LSQWESKGKPLEGRAVFVEARKVPDRVNRHRAAGEGVRVNKREESNSMFLE